MKTPIDVLFELSNAIRLNIIKAASDKEFNVTGLLDTSASQVKSVVDTLRDCPR